MSQEPVQSVTRFADFDAKRFLRLHRLTERELIALPYDRLTPMPEAYREWKKLARRLFLFAEAGGFITKEGFKAWAAL